LEFRIANLEGIQVNSQFEIPNSKSSSQLLRYLSRQVALWGEALFLEELGEEGVGLGVIWLHEEGHDGFAPGGGTVSPGVEAPRGGEVLLAYEVEGTCGAIQVGGCLCIAGSL
jgi:hypothetical protein